MARYPCTCPHLFSTLPIVLGLALSPLLTEQREQVTEQPTFGPTLASKMALILIFAAGGAATVPGFDLARIREHYFASTE